MFRMSKNFLSAAVIFFALILHAQWWDDGSFNWHNSTALVPGIRYAHLKKDQPRIMEIWIMQLDLKMDFRFHVSKKAAEYGEKIPTHPHLNIHTKRQRTMDFMSALRSEGFNVVAAVNAAPWSPWDKVYSPYATNLGLLISDGEIVSPVRKNRPSFIVYKDGRCELRCVGENEDLSNIEQAVSGFGFALIANEVQPSGNSLAPRTGFGLSADKRYLYLLAVDGRQPFFSMGCTVKEVGAMLKFFGAADGVNMDGGGSSSFVIWNGTEPQMLNHQPNGGIRAVGASLAISIR
ncbi:MAG: phosphodiester glycosidase family protein [Lentisphaeria bacterium]|nr:phosphodiester glycosidase family protein [Lentisphaeria bacterium]